MDIHYNEKYKFEIEQLRRTVEDSFFSMVLVMGIISIDKSNLVVIPTHMIKNILIVHCDLIASSVGKFGC